VGGDKDIIMYTDGSAPRSTDIAHITSCWQRPTYSTKPAYGVGQLIDCGSTLLLAPRRQPLDEWTSCRATWPLTSLGFFDKASTREDVWCIAVDEVQGSWSIRVTEV
jgi:hypothetical protein